MSNKRIDFTQLGGFPLTQDALDFMQQAYQEAIAGLAAVAGDAVIISGMMDNGTAVTDGWILYDGELLPFAGGNKQTYLIIADTTGTETFEDDSVKTVYHTRQAKFGSGTGQIAYADLVRLDSILTMKNNIATLNTTLTALQTALNTHEADVANPHSVTKSQVGLGNLPNAKSDATNLDDSNTLATSKAVNDSNLLNKRVLLTGSIYLGDIGPDSTGDDHVDDHLISFGQTITDSYMVIGSIRSVGTSEIADCTVIWAARSLGTTSFTLVVRETATAVQNTYFDYAIIKMD